MTLFPAPLTVHWVWCARCSHTYTKRWWTPEVGACGIRYWLWLHRGECARRLDGVVLFGDAA
jgi:hypothetical protein